MSSPSRRLLIATLRDLAADLREEGRRVYATAASVAADKLESEGEVLLAEAFCGRSDLVPHTWHHWRRLPDGSYGDYDDEGELVRCPGERQ